MAKPLRRWLDVLRSGDGPMARIAQNTAWLMTGKGVGAVLSLFYLAIATRTLGPAGFGHFTLILATAQVIATLISFQSWQSILKFGYAVRDKPDVLASLVSRTLAIDIAGALAGCVLAALVIWLIAPRLEWNRDTQTLALAYSIITLLAVRGAATGLLRLFDQFQAGAMADTVIPLTRMVMALVAWSFMPTVTGFVIAWALSEVTCTIAHWVIVRHLIGPRLGRLRPTLAGWTPGEDRGLFRFMAATNFTASLTSAAGQLPVLIVGLFVGATEAGLYRLAWQLANAMSKLAQSLSRSIFAEFARSNAQIDVAARDAELRMLLRRTARIALFSGVVIILTVVLLGKPLLLAMSGAAFVGAYPMLVLLGVATSALVIGVSYEPLLLATGRTTLSVTIRVIGVAALFGTLFYALPRFGGVGAAAAVMAGAMVELGLRAFAAHRVAREEPC